MKNEIVYSVFNWGDNSVKRVVKLPQGKYELTDKWTGKNIGVYEKEYVVEGLKPHSAMLIEARKI